MKDIYYKKTLPVRKVKVANFKGVSVDLYSKTLPVDFAEKQENLKILNGALVQSEYPKTINVTLDENVNCIIPVYGNDVQLLCDLSSKICILSSDGANVVKNYIEKDFDIYSSCYYKYGEEDFLLLATSKGLKKFENGEIVDTEITNEYNAICTHYYRVFGAQMMSSKLDFSDDFAPLNWNVTIDEGGYINMPFERGNIVDLVSFNQYLLVCQEDGFTKITAYSEQEDFVVKQINSPSNIKRGSVAACGDFVMFATDKGLGIFDGYNCSIICEELAGFLKDCDVQSAVDGEYCYFLCTYNNIRKDNVILAVNLVKKDYHFINCKEANGILRVKKNGKDYILLICGAQLKMLSFESNSDSKLWKSGVLDFGSPAKYKLLKAIEFGGKTNVDLKIVADDKNYFFNVSHNRSFLLNIKGKEFQIEILPQGKNINVPSPVLEYQILEEK